MSDVEIVYPQGREVVVRRLHDALAEAGYDVGSRAVAEDDRAPPASGTGAALILWDRSTMAHQGLESVASAARNRGCAIDVSADGITPLSMNDDRALIHLSGWRGDPHHPGWRKILARLEQLGHARPQPKATRVAAPPIPAVASGGSAPRRAGRAIWAAVAGILILVVVAAALLLLPNHSPPSSASASETEAAIPPPAAAPAPPEQVASGAGAQPQPEVAGPSAQNTSVPAAAVPQATRQVASGLPVASSPAHRKARPSSANRPAVRYTRYSGTMRLFCARAGRGTPQCRVFKAATGR